MSLGAKAISITADDIHIANMDELREIMQETITVFNHNNTTAVKKKDVSLLFSVLTDNCVKMYRPLSFVNKYPQFFKAETTNAEYEAQTKMKLHVMSDVEQKVTRTVIDAHQRVANVWIEKTVYLVDGSKSTVEVTTHPRVMILPTSGTLKLIESPGSGYI